MDSEVLGEFAFPTSRKRRTYKQRRDRERLYLQQKGKCWWCGRDCRLEEARTEDGFTVDHVIPLSRFGTNHWRNIVGSCHKCNEERNLRWRELKIQWLRPPKPSPDVSTFSMKEKFAILAELEFLPTGVN